MKRIRLSLTILGTGVCAALLVGCAINGFTFEGENDDWNANVDVPIAFVADRNRTGQEDMNISVKLNEDFTAEFVNFPVGTLGKLDTGYPCLEQEDSYTGSGTWKFGDSVEIVLDTGSKDGYLWTKIWMGSIDWQDSGIARCSEDLSTIWFLKDKRI